MAETTPDEDLLLEVLNSTPVVDGRVRDMYADADQARARLAALGGRGTAEELGAVLSARRALQAVVRGQEPATALAPLLAGVTRVPVVTGEGVRWSLEAPPGRELAVRAVLTWAHLAEHNPGRLRPCANDECLLFLIDHSKAGTARWCSMAVCGNRMKARRHHERSRAQDR
ncbi:hypothetical protein Sme01_69070 [Sphaerisporangium melleum]|uniref:Zinc finger CGNR domain-containing protein n=1 Tax=Sphaerisporangium melleum TaxID=321316 RepID=A0A917RLJ1_9ACTN|nr:CGNR zinc finger domain-containing protein [Sphaerisporangium melleum]GGL12718.1 hypothetical protein GCM10007964_63460 [Sphaerisporangium melleum]GII74431.1 hypothetical protein Sme01_69070 [Sphaerisporangium melleum]